MSFVQLFLTHILSLEFVLGFCHGIAKGGDILFYYQPWFRGPISRVYGLYQMSTGVNE